MGDFTERDIVKALGQHFDAAGHPVSDWMTSDPTTVPADTPAGEALRTMLDRGFTPSGDRGRGRGRSGLDARPSAAAT